LHGKLFTANFLSYDIEIAKKKKKSAFIGFAYQNNDFFVLFINYVFNSSQK
jgi:hypothetical protein